MHSCMEVEMAEQARARAVFEDEAADLSRQLAAARGELKMVRAAAEVEIEEQTRARKRATPPPWFSR